MSRKWQPVGVAIVIMALLAISTACRTEPAEPTSVPATSPPPTSTRVATATPSVTNTLSPSNTPTRAATATMTATSTPVPTNTALPTPTPTTGPEVLVDAAIPLCETAFSSSEWTKTKPETPMLTMVRVEYEENGWVHGLEYRAHGKPFSAVLPHTEALSDRDVRTLVCIQEGRSKAGTYSDGETAYRVVWDVRLVRWPSGEVLDETTLYGEASLLKSKAGPGYGAPPKEKLFQWLDNKLDYLRVLYTDNPIFDMAIAPDGQTAATLWVFVRLWDIESEQQLHLLGNGDDHMTFSPDGTLVATGSPEGVVRLWSAATGEVLHELDGSTKGNFLAGRLIFSPDGATLVSSAPDGTLRLWDVVTGAEIRTLKGHENEVIKLTFLPDGKSLASLSYLKEQYFGPLIVWDLATGKPILTLDGVNRALFSSDGGTVAIWTEPGIKLLDTVSGQIKRSLDQSVLLGWSPDDKALVVGDSSTSRLLDVETWTVKHSLDKGFWSEPTFSPDSSILAIRNRDIILLFDVATGEKLYTLTGHRSNITKMVFSPDGKTLFSGSRDGTIRVWDVATGQ